jgi:hypothetical protein
VELETLIKPEELGDERTGVTAESTSVVTLRKKGEHSGTNAGNGWRGQQEVWRWLCTLIGEGRRNERGACAFIGEEKILRANNSGLF